MVGFTDLKVRDWMFPFLPANSERERPDWTRQPDHSAYWSKDPAERFRSSMDRREFRPASTPMSQLHRSLRPGLLLEGLSSALNPPIAG